MTKYMYIVFVLLTLVSCNSSAQIKIVYDQNNMQDTIDQDATLFLQPQDHYEYNDLVVFKYINGKNECGRILGVPKDTIRIDSCIIYRNGKEILPTPRQAKFYSFIAKDSTVGLLLKKSFSIGANRLVWRGQRHLLDSLANLGLVEGIFPYRSPNTTDVHIDSVQHWYYQCRLCFTDKDIVIPAGYSEKQTDSNLRILPTTNKLKQNENLYFFGFDNNITVTDSRSAGLLPNSAIIGKVVKIVPPKYKRIIIELPSK
jgi:hypothetical protein